MRVFRPEQACWHLDLFIHSLCLLWVSPTYPNMHSEGGRETPRAGQACAKTEEDTRFEVY